MHSILKRIPFICSLLCSICIFSVGFSTWISIKPIEPKNETYGNFVSYGVNQAVCTSQTLFNFCPTSFLVLDSTTEKLVPTGTGIISAEYVVTPDSSLESWSLDMTLSYSGLINPPSQGIFSTITPTETSGNLSRNLTASVYLGTVTNGNVTYNTTSELANTLTVASDGKTATVTVGSTAFSTQKSVYHLRVDYEFNIPQGASFWQTFGQHLSVKQDNKTTFTSTGSIREGVAK